MANKSLRYAAASMGAYSLQIPYPKETYGWFPDILSIDADSAQ